MKRSTLANLALASCLAAATVGCSSGQYTTPGVAANLATFGVEKQKAIDAQTPYDVHKALGLQPAAQFPAHLAVARVQGSGYRSFTAQGFGRGAYSVVTTRDVETDEHFDRIAKLPLVAGVGPVNRLLLPADLRGDEELRHAAALLHADMLLLYTFDTQVFIDDADSPADVVTLGFLPSRRPRVHSTASAALLDTRTGYVYAVAEGSAKHDQLANVWTTEIAVDQARRAAETEAFTNLVGAFEKSWAGVVKQHAAAPVAKEAAR